MSKRSIQIQETLYCGIDVSAKSLTVAIQRVGQPVEQTSFPNNPNGHKALIVWLRQHANEFGLTKEDGNPNEQGIEDVAKIANWDTRGGAPKTPGSE